MFKSFLSPALRAFVALLAALSFSACSTTNSATEERAASPEAREFNRQTTENSRNPEPARDSAAARP